MGVTNGHRDGTCEGYRSQDNACQIQQDNIETRMSTDKDKMTLSVIQADLLRELMKDKCTIFKYLDVAVKRAEFQAMRYKEKECYDDLLALKRARNIFKTFIEVTSHEKIECD